MPPARVDVVAVLVDHGVCEVGAATGRHDHQAAVPLLARVAAGGDLRALLVQLAPFDDPDRHALDLVGVRSAAQEPGIPVDVGVGADVEPHRAAFVVAQDDLLRRGRRRQSGRDEESEHRGERRPCHRPTVEAAPCFSG